MEPRHDPVPVLVNREGAVVVLTLNEPDRRNALSLEMRSQLRAELADAMLAADCRSVVITGSKGTFCAGGDLSTMPTDDVEAGRERLAILAEVVQLVYAGPKPVVAAVEGPAFGAGVSLAAASDYVVAADTAQFCCAFGQVGLVADAGLLWTLPRRIGEGRARRMVMFSDVVDAQEAYASGLVDEVCEAGKASEVAVAQAARLAAGAPLAIEATKSLLMRPSRDLAEFLRIEAGVQVGLFGSRDFSEGRDAFFAKRPPVFKGS